MSCQQPLAGRRYVDESTGQVLYHVSGLYNPSLRKDMGDQFIPIPCGKCLGCRLDYSRKWADRMILELDHTGKGIFLTLTYDDEHVPRAYVYDDGNEFVMGQTLRVRDLQLFMKRLRKHFSDREIRFYAAGEYGSTTGRPHYHAIIYGIGLEDFFDCILHGKNELGQEYFTSGLMMKLWDNGFITMSEVSYKTCAYVSRYVMKKVNNISCDYEMLPTFMHEAFEKEFNVMSRRPGIAGYYLEDHPDQEDLSKFFLPAKDGSVEVCMPKYVLEKVRELNPEQYDKIVEERKEAAINMEDFMVSGYGSDLGYFDMLDLKAKILESKTKVLRDTRK